MPPGRDNIPATHPRHIAKLAAFTLAQLAHEPEEVRRLVREYQDAEDERYRRWKGDALNR